MKLKLKNIIIILFIGYLYSYEVIDSSLILNHNIDKKAILIPDYEKKYFNFKNQFLGKSKKIFIDFDLGYISNNCSNLIISPSIKYKKIKFKINLDYLINNQSSLYKNQWDEAFDVLEKIEYLNLILFKNKVNLNLGEIKNLTFGHGYLLNRYGNNYNAPIDKNLGITFRFKNSNDSFTYSLFASDLEDLLNSKGLIGHHFSFLVSELFPFRFGFGHVVDLNQFTNYENMGFSRQIHGFESDFTFPLLSSSRYSVLFIGEISGLRFPETRYYKRVDDDQFTNDKKSRDGTWGIAFPGIKYISQNFEFKLALNYNSAIHSPYYFNRTYNFEKVRHRQYNIQNNESLYPDEADLLMSFSDSENNIFLPKDMYGMINDYENTYPSYGVSASLNSKLNTHSNIIIDYSYFLEFGNTINDLSFHSLSIDLIGKLNILSLDTEFDIFFTKNFCESSQFSILENENTMYGARIDLNIYKRLSIFGELKYTFYEIDSVPDPDGVIDQVSYINMGLKLKY